MERIYLDYASTTPIDPEILPAIKDFLDSKSELFGNPGSLHSFGQKALKILDYSREAVARAICANQNEIVFTSSATEANNLALRGAIGGFLKEKKHHFVPKIITSSIEHPSALETIKSLKADGLVEIFYAPVDRDGIVDINSIKNELDEKTILISVMWVNNETGAIQPVEEIVKIVKDFRKKNGDCSYPLFHTDAVQAFIFKDLNVIKSGVDLMTLSSHKIYGPKGAGCLYLNKERVLDRNMIIPIITGGGQEENLRSGTENIFSIFGFAKACEILEKTRDKDSKRFKELSDYFMEEVFKIIPDLKINGNLKKNAPHIINLFVSRLENIHIALDISGIAVSSGSACSQKLLRPSAVLKAMGFDDSRSYSSVRFSFGRETNRKEIDTTVSRLKDLINKN